MSGPPPEASRLPPPLEVFRRAAAGEEAALEALRARHGGALRRLKRKGRARHGDLDLDAVACARGLARVAALVVDAELAAEGSSLPSPEDVVGTLVLEDVYLAEALLAGRPRAWARLEQILEAAWRAVSAHFSGSTPRDLRREIRETVLGTFFLEGKVASFRATAPLAAWARQVIFNIFRQRVHERRAGREPAQLSQIGDRDADSEGLLPPSREPPPPEVLVSAEWRAALEIVVPRALDRLDRDERTMMEVLPARTRTQVELARELGISPFKLNRWYKDVRRRFVKDVTHQLRLLVGLEDTEVHQLVAYLSGLWRSASSPGKRDFLQ